MKFEQDLQDGREAEIYVLDIIRRKYPLAFIIDGCHKAYDIFIPERDYGVEVKNDRQSQITGNAFIEVECNGIESGIITTRANIWVYCVKNNCYWCETQQIRKMIIQNNLRFFEDKPKGETSVVCAYIVELDLLERYSIKRTTRTQ